MGMKALCLFPNIELNNDILIKAVEIAQEN